MNELLKWGAFAGIAYLAYNWFVNSQAAQATTTAVPNSGVPPVQSDLLKAAWAKWAATKPVAICGCKPGFFHQTLLDGTLVGCVNQTIGGPDPGSGVIACGSQAPSAFAGIPGFSPGGIGPGQVGMGRYNYYRRGTPMRIR